MKKSSLGRRSSIASNKNTETRKSFIPKPNFGTTSKHERGSSMDRETASSSTKRELNLPSTLKRSRSFVDMGRNSLYQTPVQPTRRITAGSTSGRSSSMGGSKSGRKETRPISEKSFQTESQIKVQEYFLKRNPNLLDKGSIKPMTSGMFTDLVNFLIQRFFKKVVLTRTNFMEEVPSICRILSYKGKAEKSWLMTVNAPHSWPYVVSFLAWLVDLNQTAENLNLIEAMYPEKIEEDDRDNGDHNFELLTPHLFRGYKLPDHTQELNAYIEKYRNSLGISEEDIEKLQMEYNDLQKDLNEIEDTLEEEEYQTLRNQFDSLKRDAKNTSDFIYDTENYVSNITKKRKEKLLRFKEYDEMIEELQKEKEKLQAILSSQDMTQERKQEIECNLAALRGEIRRLSDEINDYQDEIYKEDIKLVSVRNQFNKAVQSYNKEIAVNAVSLPGLKNLQIEDVKYLDAPNSAKRFEQVDFNIKELKTSLRSTVRDLEMEVEKSNITSQKIEDELALLNEEKEKMLDQCQQLQNNIDQMKKAIAKEKEQLKIDLNEYQEKIKCLKEFIVKTNEGKEIELASETDIYSKEKKECENYLEKAFEMLRNKKKSLKEFENKLQELTKKKLTETRRKIEELVKDV